MGKEIMENSIQALNKIRRSDRAKEEAWMRAFLIRGAMGTLATAQEEQPFLVTRNYAYDSDRHAIYLHGARKGRTFDNLQVNPLVCFSVSEMGRLLPADTALEVGIEYAGVVVFGKATLVDNPSEAAHGLQLLLDKYFPHLSAGKDYEPIDQPGLKRTAVLRIDIESWSGKEMRAEEDYPGAFYYGGARREA